MIVFFIFEFVGSYKFLITKKSIDFLGNCQIELIFIILFCNWVLLHSLNCGSQTISSSLFLTSNCTTHLVIKCKKVSIFTYVCLITFFTFKTHYGYQKSSGYFTIYSSFGRNMRRIENGQDASM